MMNDTNGGKTQATASWLIDNIKDGETQSFCFLTGSGGHTIASAAVRKWQQRRPDGVAIAISHQGVLVEQWERYGMKAITQIRASRELAREGTILGYAPAEIGLVIVEEPSHDPAGRLATLLESLSGAAILKMVSGGAPFADTGSVPMETSLTSAGG